MADDALFDIVNAPAQATLRSLLTNSDGGGGSTFVDLPYADYESMGSPEYMQIGSEILRVINGGSLPRQNSTLENAISATDTVLRVKELAADGSNLLTHLRVNPTLGITQPAFFRGTDTGPVETVRVRDVLPYDAAVDRVSNGAGGFYNVRRVVVDRAFTYPRAELFDATLYDLNTPAGTSASLSWPAGATFRLFPNREGYQMFRGTLGSETAEHAAWSPIQRLYRSEDYVSWRRINDPRLDLALLAAYNPAQPSTTRQLAQSSSPDWQFIGLRAVLPIPAGTLIRVHATAAAYHRDPGQFWDRFYILKMADAGGTPLVPGAPWFADAFWPAANPVAPRSISILEFGSLTSDNGAFDSAATADLRVAPSGLGIDILTAGTYAFVFGDNVDF